MDPDLYFALRQISLAFAVVLHANHLIEIRSESSLKGFINFFINENLPDIIDIRNAFISHQYENLDDSHWKLIELFNSVSKKTFPFRIHLSEIDDPVLLDTLRFAFYIFDQKESDLFSALKLCLDDYELVCFVKNILHNYEEYPHTCPDKLFLLNMNLNKKISKGRSERKTKKVCLKQSEMVTFNTTNINNGVSIFLTKQCKKAPLKGCTQTALQLLGLLRRR